MNNENDKGFQCHDKSQFSQWQEKIKNQKYYQHIVGVLHEINPQPSIQRDSDALHIHGTDFDVTDRGYCILTKSGTDMDIQVMLLIIRAKAWKSVDIIGKDEAFCLKAGLAVVKNGVKLRDRTMMQKIKTLQADIQHVLKDLKKEGARMVGQSCDPGKLDISIPDSLPIGLTTREAREAIQAGIDVTIAENLKKKNKVGNSLKEMGAILARNLSGSDKEIASLKQEAVQAGWLNDHIDALIQQGYEAEKNRITQKLNELPKKLRDLGLQKYISKKENKELRLCIDEAENMGMPLNEINFYVQQGMNLGERRYNILQEIKAYGIKNYQNSIHKDTDPDFSDIIKKAHELEISDFQIDQQILKGENEERKRLQDDFFKGAKETAYESSYMMVYGAADNLSTDTRLDFVIQTAIDMGVSHANINEYIKKGIKAALDSQETQEVVISVTQKQNCSPVAFKQQVHDQLFNDLLVKRMNYISKDFHLPMNLYQLWAFDVDIENMLMGSSKEKMIFNAGERWANESIANIATLSTTKFAMANLQAKKLGLDFELYRKMIIKENHHARLIIGKELMKKLHEAGEKWAHSNKTKESNFDLINVLRPALFFGLQVNVIKSVVIKAMKAVNNHVEPPVFLLELSSLEKKR